MKEELLFVREYEYEKEGMIIEKCLKGRFYIDTFFGFIFGY